MTKIVFHKTKKGPALPIFTVVAIVDDLRDKYWIEEAQVGQPNSYAADARKEAYDDLVERLKEIGDHIEFTGQ